MKLQNIGVWLAVNTVLYYITLCIILYICYFIFEAKKNAIFTSPKIRKFESTPKLNQNSQIKSRHVTALVINSFSCWLFYDSLNDKSLRGNIFEKCVHGMYTHPQFYSYNSR